MFSQQRGTFPVYTCLIIAAVAGAVLLFLAGRRAGSEQKRASAAKMAFFVPLSALVGARLLYFVFAFEDFLYDYGILSVFNPGVGSCMLYGGVIGAMLCAAVIARTEHVPVGAACDELVLPGLAAIAVCRFAEWFTTEGIGPVIESDALCFFPLAVENAYGEWNLAVFMLEAAAAAILFVLFARRKKTREPGKLALAAIVLFACCQIPLENARWDDCMRIGFVRVSQVIAAVSVLLVTLMRMTENKKDTFRRAVGVLFCVTGIGIIEWAQDKTNIPNALLYVVMVALCAAMAWLSGAVFENRRKA